MLKNHDLLFSKTHLLVINTSVHLLQIPHLLYQYPKTPYPSPIIQYLLNQIVHGFIHNPNKYNIKSNKPKATQSQNLLIHSTNVSYPPLYLLYPIPHGENTFQPIIL